MVNEYVKDDIVNAVNHDAYSSDDEYHEEPMSFLDWENYYANDLHNMWWNINQYMSSSGSCLYMLQYADYNDFAEFCWKNSSGYKYRPAVGH